MMNEESERNEATCTLDVDHSEGDCESADNDEEAEGAEWTARETRERDMANILRRPLHRT